MFVLLLRKHNDTIETIAVALGESALPMHFATAKQRAAATIAWVKQRYTEEGLGPGELSWLPLPADVARLSYDMDIGELYASEVYQTSEVLACQEETATASSG